MESTVTTWQAVTFAPTYSIWYFLFGAAVMLIIVIAVNRGVFRSAWDSIAGMFRNILRKVGF